MGTNNRTIVPLEVRFWRHVQKTDTCWNWDRPNPTLGYGYIADGQGKKQCAHRVAWELMRGPIPKGLQIDHLCRNRACVNPDHLEPVTQRTNIMRGEGLSSKRDIQTHCKHGHSMENARVNKDGYRYCRECSKLYNRGWRMAKALEVANAQGIS